MAWIHSTTGKAPSSPEILVTAERNCEKMISVVEKALTGKQFMVSNQLTLADLFIVAAITRGYQFVSCNFSLNPNTVLAGPKTNSLSQVFKKKWAASHPAIHTWYIRLKSDPIWKKIDGDPYVLDDA